MHDDYITDYKVLTDHVTGEPSCVVVLLEGQTWEQLSTATNLYVHALFENCEGSSLSGSRLDVDGLPAYFMIADESDDER